MSQGRDSHGRFAGGGGGGKSAGFMSKVKGLGKPGSTVSGRQKGTGRTWTAKVGPSGKLVGKVYD